jgi:hypothetical protein
MRYTFQSLQRHNFISIVKRKAYTLVWPIALYFAVQVLFPGNQFTKDHFHLYACLVIEIFQLFSISRDNINEIIIDSAKRSLQISYYNTYEGQMEETYSFSDIKIDIEETRKKAVRQINFFIKRKADFTLEKNKDNFKQQDLESLKELLYSITSSKNS